AFEHGKAFIPFITAGDPSLDVTEKLILACEEAGADLIEIGIPFSDPTAEGPVIQAANERALSGGVTTEKIMDMVTRIRKKSDIPLVFMTYANVVFSYAGGKSQTTYASNFSSVVSGKTGSAVSDSGEKKKGVIDAASRSVSSNSARSDVDGIGESGNIEAFVEKCHEIGIQGLILPDIPYEEKSEFDDICKKYGVDLVSLVAPTSNERIRMIASEASGFLYCVSSLGVTGMRSTITTDVGAMTALAKQANPDLPTAIGFGISNAETAKSMSEKADGVIVGSAIVKIIAEHGAESVPYVKEFVKTLKDAIR
ncbi:MAG: tryptophan synthase subunit alpha, partial [Eubacterium sp.]|nr:tryptophan synthase subunit alpha [Eubacterium sp.]